MRCRVDRPELERLGPALEGYLALFDECAIAPTRKLIAAYIRGQLGPLPRKSVMPMAREAGIPPRTLQELLSLHRWDEDRMRQILRQRHGAPQDEVLFLHESECIKKGNQTPGVDRQPLRGLGRPGNACVISHLASACGERTVLLDSELFLTPRWCQERTLRRRAGIPDEVRFRTRDELALELVDRAWSTGTRTAMLVLDPGRALDPAWRRLLSSRSIPFAGEVDARARGTLPGSPRARAVEEIVAAEGGVLPLKSGVEAALVSRPIPFVPDGAAAGDRPLTLLGLRSPWSLQLRYAVTGAVESPERAAERALGRPALAQRLNRDLAEIGFDHFEVRRHLSLRRHLVLSAASLQFLQEARASASRPSAPPLRAALPR